MPLSSQILARSRTPSSCCENYFPCRLTPISFMKCLIRDDLGMVATSAPGLGAHRDAIVAVSDHPNEKLCG